MRCNSQSERFFINLKIFRITFYHYQFCPYTFYKHTVFREKWRKYNKLIFWLCQCL